MRCPACGASVEGRFRFCPDCGRRLPAASDEPGAAVAAPAAALEGERKQVTVLFCDLVGSTAIADRRDPEEYHDLLQRYLTAAFPAIYRFDGVVNTLAGDGLMAIFGAPVAHEDDPQRAVRAALAVRDAVAGLAERVRSEGGPALTVRVGVHSGPVVVGGFGTDLKRDYTAIGDTTNVAARLQALAAPGAILVSEATWRLVQGFFDVRSAGELEVRGKSEPVRAYEVLRRKTAATAMSIAAERGLTPLVGRTGELARLEAAFAGLGRGQSQVVTIVGGAGSGKSRLVWEFRRRLADEPVVFFEGYCSSISQTVPYQPILGMLRRHFGIEVGETPMAAGEKLASRLGVAPAELARAYPLLSRLLSLPFSERPQVPAEQLKQETFDAVGRLFVSLSLRTPVVALVEDLHCADELSRELLASFASSMEHSRIMMLVTTRPEARPQWRTRAERTEIVLAPLGDDEVRAVARAIVGGALPREIEDHLVARAAGSPFFTEEFTRALVEEGQLVCEDGTCRPTRSPQDIPIPHTVQEVIAARLDRLPPVAKRVVQVAAVLGRQFRVDDVRALLVDDGGDVGAAVDELERRGILHRKLTGGADELRFGESLTQEVAYEGLLHRQRRQLHDRVATLLEDRVDLDGAQRSALVAYHRARGDDRRAAVAALLAAARAAEELPSYITAARFFSEAAALADAEGDALVAEALEAHFGVARLVVLFGLPMIREGAEAAARGRALAERLGATVQLTSIMYFQGILAMSEPGGEFSRGIAIAEQAREIAMREGLGGQAHRIGRGLAINYALDGRHERARELADAALAEFEPAEDPAQPSDIYLSMRWVSAFVHFAADELDAADAEAEATVALAERAANRTMQSTTCTLLAQVALLRGRNEAARQHADRALALGEAIGNVNVLPAAGAVALLARAALGEPADVERLLDAIDRGLDPHGLVQMNFRFLNEAWLLAPDGARRLERVAVMRQAGGGGFRRAILSLIQGDLLAAAGRVPEAVAAYREVMALADALRARSLLVEAVVSAARLGDAAAALVRPRLPEAMAACRRLGLERYRGGVERLLLAGLGMQMGTPGESRA